MHWFSPLPQEAQGCAFSGDKRQLTGRQRLWSSFEDAARSWRDTAGGLSRHSTTPALALHTPRHRRAGDSIESGVFQVSLPWERAPGIAPSNPGHRASSLLQVGKRQRRAAGCGTCQQLEPVSQHLHLGVRGARWAARGNARGSRREERRESRSDGSSSR